MNVSSEHFLRLHQSEQSILEDYANRMGRLHLVVEEEGRAVSRDSERDFWEFVHRHPFAQAGQLVVTDEGFVRLVWKRGDEEHIGIRFLGNRMVRYVIFNRRPGERGLSEFSGDDTADGVVRQAHACGLSVFRA